MERIATPRQFNFDRDRFAFVNGLLWEYQFDPATGKTKCRPNLPKPDYAHRCFVMVRVARQFLYHARFEPGQSRLEPEAYRRLLRQVLVRNPRVPCARGQEVVFPGFAGLHDLTAQFTGLFKAECGGAWRSYIMRSHWRMVLPISRAHQQRTLNRLLAVLGKGLSPVVHLVKFPALTLNHGMMIYAAQSRAAGYDFEALDPNDSARPARLTYEEPTRTFSLPPNRYWAGGPVNVILIYQSWWM